MDEEPGFRGGFSVDIARALPLMAKRTPKYEAFPPGDLIREELGYRGWTQGDLARIMGRPLQIVNQIINGSKAITARTARELEAALGPEAQFWMNLETSWRLYIEAKADPAIAVRAKARDKVAPNDAARQNAASSKGAK
jgi:HTH-type transcriptional regulator/antitoxin HigA